MRYIPIILLLTLGSCGNSGDNFSSITKDSTTQASDTDSNDIDPGQESVRSEFIAMYNTPKIIDLVFKVRGQRHEVILRHSCIFDSAIIVPAKYNSDIKSEFRTHNFQSDLLILKNKDTISHRIISKQLFSNYLFPELDTFGVLLYPELKCDNDSFLVNYSISIPVTDALYPGTGCRYIPDTSSLCDMLFSYTKKNAMEEKTSDELSPQAKRLIGSVKLPGNFDYKKELQKQLEKKYGK